MEGGVSLTQPQRRLAKLMSAISEECWSALWLMGTEFSLWRIAHGGNQDWGMSRVSDDEVSQLLQLSAEAGGWIVWDDDAPGDDGCVFVPLEEWESLYEAGP